MTEWTLHRQPKAQIDDHEYSIWRGDDPVVLANIMPGEDGVLATIVHAVNNHDALVKALEILLGEATSFSVSGVYFDEDCMGHKGPQLARDALAAVGTGKQP